MGLWRNSAGFLHRQLHMKNLRPPAMERSVGKMRKKLPIGIDGFEKIRTNDFYYVDKTLFIKELVENWVNILV